MTGNVFGENFKIITFGESHGKAIGCVIDGVKAGLKISEKDIQKELDRRKPGQSAITTQRKEDDLVEILSGVFEGKTTGTPIALLIRNKDQRSNDYSKIKDVFRPGHAAYGFLKKFGIYDYRGGGRASGRETAARVAAGAIAKKILAKNKIKIMAYVIEAAGIKAHEFDKNEIEKNPLRCPDKIAAVKIIKKIENFAKKGDSVGGIVEIVVTGVPVGLGEPVFGKLEAELAKAMLSIGAVKGIEFGAGFECARMTGSECNDSMYSSGKKILFRKNDAGGIVGGISTGQDIVFRIAIKPTSSISLEQKTVTTQGKNTKIKIEGRHDPCICPRIVPVAEAMTALVLQDALQVQELRKNNR